MNIFRKDTLTLFHGSQSGIVEYPELRIDIFTKDFGVGFYCTDIHTQAVKWATRFGDGYVSQYSFDRTSNTNLDMLVFEGMTEEWLDFIVHCRAGGTHSYDIVEGPMADDTIYNYIQDYIEGNIKREMFWALAKFAYPTHQVCFCTKKALEQLKYMDGTQVSRRKY